MAAVKVKIGAEIITDLQESFFQRSKWAAIEQQFDFEAAPAGFVLSFVVKIA
jgi:hypothetical protein